LDVSGVKLDRSLIANVTEDRSARIITTSILRLCDELGVGTLAEGIETAEQAEFVMARGCYRLQGFGIARPMDRASVVSMIKEGAPIDIPTEQPLIARSA
jgi:EAL domain-containing protein (putative c-di-GMP-specific phosphodiesterase class I)